MFRPINKNASSRERETERYQAERGNVKLMKCVVREAEGRYESSVCLCVCVYLCMLFMWNEAATS